METKKTLEEIEFVEKNFMKRIKRVLVDIDCTLQNENKYSDGEQEKLVAKLLDTEARYKKYYPGSLS